ncbi:MAG: hypothetical protein J5983_00155, partial [Ruminococcus sp.]|nr:hypothetical protein [Ruminococcus sp.]
MKKIARKAQSTRASGLQSSNFISASCAFFARSAFLRKGIRQMGMYTFPFAAARERKKLAKRVSYRFVLLHYLTKKTFPVSVKWNS